MNYAFTEKIFHFMRSFILEEIAVLLYWMIVARYGAVYFASTKVVFYGAVKSSAVLFVVKLAAAVLFDVWKSRLEKHNWRTGGILVSALWLAGIGASYAGWTVFSRMANMPVSGRAMALLCAASTANILVFDQMIRSILGERTAMLTLLRAVHEKMDSGLGDFDDDAFGR